MTNVAHNTISFLTIVTLGLTNQALALHQDSKAEVSLPKYHGGVYVSAEALYLAPDIENRNYGFTFQSQSGVDTYRTHTVDMDHDWGYAITLGREVAGTGNDFRVNWTDISWNLSDSVVDVPASVGTIFAQNECEPREFAHSNDGVEVTKASGKIDIDYQKVDFELGQLIKVGVDSVMLRFHAGLRYADIDSKFQIEYYPLPSNVYLDVVNRFKAESDYDGLGPRLGVDSTWHFNEKFSLIANISGAVLVGDASAKQLSENMSFQEQIALQGTPALNFLNEARRVNHTNKIVPAFETRLGARVNHTTENQTQLALEAGYHSSHYFDVDYKLIESGTDISMSGFYVKMELVI